MLSCIYKYYIYHIYPISHSLFYYHLILILSILFLRILSGLVCYCAYKYIYILVACAYIYPNCWNENILQLM